MTNVLDGIRVLELTQWAYVPSAGAILADWGATVVKVEHPVQGDPIRGLVSSAMTPSGAANTVDFMWEIPNRGKRSIGVDLTTPGGRDLVYRLAKDCDVFLTSFLAPARRKLQLDVDDIRAHNPGIVYARQRPGHRAGPTATKAASTSGRSGHAAGPRHRSRRPTLGSRSACPAAVSATTRAAWRSPEVSLPRSCAASARARARSSTARCSTPRCGRCRRGSCRACSSVRTFRCHRRRRAASPPIRSWACYRTKDDRFVNLVFLQSDRYWPDFCRGSNDPSWSTTLVLPTPRHARTRRFVSLLDEIFAERTLDDWRDILDATEGCGRRCRTSPRSATTGKRRERLRPRGDRERRDVVLSWSRPVQFDETPPELTPAPELGQHTEEVLLELGLTWDEITAHKSAATSSELTCVSLWCYMTSVDASWIAAARDAQEAGEVVAHDRLHLFVVEPVQHRLVHGTGREDLRRAGSRNRRRGSWYPPLRPPS